MVYQAHSCGRWRFIDPIIYSLCLRLYLSTNGVLLIIGIEPQA